MLSWLYDSLLRVVASSVILWYSSRIKTAVAMACAVALRRVFGLVPSVHLVYDATEIEALAKNACAAGAVGFVTNGSRGTYTRCCYLFRWDFVAYVPPSAQSSGGGTGTVSEPAWIVTLRGDAAIGALLDLGGGGDLERDEMGTQTTKARRTVAALKRWGDPWRRRYAKKTIPMFFDATPEQRDVLDLVKAAYRDVPAERNRIVNVLLHGLPGTGKSTIGMLLAEELGGTYVDTFGPTDDNDMFEALHTSAQPSKAKPLIVVLNEFEDVLLAVHRQRHRAPSRDADAGGRPPNVEIHNKTTLNKFLDMVYYEHVIVIMTTNWHRRDVDKLDASCLRAGRVHVCVELKRKSQGGGS